MLKTISISLACLTVALTVLGLTACGRGTSDDDAVVAKVGENAITRASLDHWMSIIVSGDYFEKVGKRAPKRLVSDPPNYAACVAAEEAVLRARVTVGTRPTAAELESKCRQLYQVLKQQAMAFLISSRRLVNQAAEQGVKVTDDEVMQNFRRLKAVQAKEHPDDAQFKKYLADRGWTLPVALFLIKRNLLSARIEQKLGKLGSGSQSLIDFYKESTQKWTAKTTCSAGYVVEGCRQYKFKKTAPGPSPAVLLEEIAGVL